MGAELRANPLRANPLQPPQSEDDGERGLCCGCKRGGVGCDCVIRDQRTAFESCHFLLLPYYLISYWVCVCIGMILP